MCYAIDRVYDMPKLTFFQVELIQFNSVCGASTTPVNLSSGTVFGSKNSSLQSPVTSIPIKLPAFRTDLALLCISRHSQPLSGAAHFSRLIPTISNRRFLLSGVAQYTAWHRRVLTLSMWFSLRSVVSRPVFRRCARFSGLSSDMCFPRTVVFMGLSDSKVYISPEKSRFRSGSVNLM